MEPESSSTHQPSVSVSYGFPQLQSSQKPIQQIQEEAYQEALGLIVTRDIHSMATEHISMEWTYKLNRTKSNRTLANMFKPKSIHESTAFIQNFEEKKRPNSI